MRTSKPFVVFKRILPSGKVSYYYQARLPDGSRTNPRSTGAHTKNAAERYCNELYRKGELIPKPTLKFKDYAENWWDWEKCDYVKRQRRVRGRFSPSYAASQRASLVRYIKPAFDAMNLSDITTGDIEKWRSTLVDDKKLKCISANHILANLKVMLHEAARLQLIPFDPSANVELYRDDSREKGILEVDEAQRMFTVSALDEIWQGDEIHFVINMIAMIGGLRQGEILSLKIRDLRPKGVNVANSWDRETKQLVLPKNGKTRYVPLAAPAMEILNRIAKTVKPTAEGYLFPNKPGTGPLDHKAVNDHFQAALAKIGIDEKTRVSRNITFHSWRHYANTRIRETLGDLLTRSFIGHGDVEMQDHYTHQMNEDYERFIKAQMGLLGRAA